MKKIVCISDTHRQEKNVILPEGDILIHSGDFDIYNQNHLDNVIDWFKSLDFRHIVFIGGNHDLFLEDLIRNQRKPNMPKNIHYLYNQSIEIEGIKFYGSPYTPQFGNWAFMGHLEELNKIWSTIPLDTDIIITHGQPFGINDVVRGISQGCPALRDKIKEIKPKLYCGGHLHEQYGIYKDQYTIYVNPSIMDEFYNPCNKPIVIDYE